MKTVIFKIVLGINFACFGTVFAQSNDSVECARKALQVGNFTSDQAVKLCINGGTMNNVDCAIKAVKDVQLTADQSIELCANKALRLENMVHFMNAIPK